MAIINKPNTFSPNTTIASSEVNADFDTIYNAFNGNIEAANLASNAVTTAKIADANVTTAKVADANITDAKLVYGKLRRRQGGSATDWTSQGTTTYDYSATNTFMQAGARTMNTSFASTAITFPVAFAQKPLVFVNVLTANSANVIATAKDVTASGFNLYTNSAASGAAEVASWLAIGE